MHRFSCGLTGRIYQVTGKDRMRRLSSGLHFDEKLPPAAILAGLIFRASRKGSLLVDRTRKTTDEGAVGSCRGRRYAFRAAPFAGLITMEVRT